MDSLQKLEASLDESLRQKAPKHIPREWAKMIALNLWWIAIILAILQLYSAISLWDWGHSPVDIVTAVNYYTTGVARHLSLFFYLAVFMTAGVALLLLLAAPPLKAMRKSGWNLFFYSILLNVLASCVALFAEGGGVWAFLRGIVGVVLAVYVLFQVREYFIMSHDVLVTHRRHTEHATTAVAADENNDPEDDHERTTEHKTKPKHKTTAAGEAPTAEADTTDD